MISLREAVKSATTEENNPRGYFVSSTVQGKSSDQDETQTNRLMDRFSKKNPKFASLLESTAKKLAPLATTDDGGATLTSLRMAAGITQKEFARRIGQKQSNVSYLESGQHSNLRRDTMKRICTALGCDMKSLDEAIDNTVAIWNARDRAQESAMHESRADATRMCA